MRGELPVYQFFSLSHHGSSIAVVKAYDDFFASDCKGVPR